MYETDHHHAIARNHQQSRPVGKDTATDSGSGDEEKEMEMDWAHFKETNAVHGKAAWYVIHRAAEPEESQNDVEGRNRDGDGNRRKKHGKD
ncbi:hypothetical protein ElyMa_000693900 [Elysia marginata]|uniref:Uncharacterized protein n=1 Tax=Elysia marginata TaxID=1093978 RepID=A0AAV4GII2_9GAST|nr:hypothetical protein ElyMa_000693900 [Elysia marginata]